MGAPGGDRDRPVRRATLARAPDQVSVTFGSEFEAPIASLKVYDRHSQRVDIDDAAVYAEHPRTVMATTGDQRTVTVAQDAIARLQRTVRMEAVLLVGVLVVTVLLASQPTP